MSHRSLGLAIVFRAMEAAHNVTLPRNYVLLVGRYIRMLADLQSE